ncbi:MAG: DPP IV N-terminal domain-containing protein [Butyricimonas faecihominis]
MMRSIVCILLFLMGSSVFAQKADFKACAKFSERNLSDYVYSLSVYPSWIGNSDFFWYYYTTGDGTVYYLVDAKKGKKQELFSTERLAARLAELTGKTEDVRNFKLGGFRFEGDNPYRLMFSRYGKDFEYDVKRDVLKEYSRERKENSFSRVPYWQRWSPDSNYMVYAYKHNVYIQEKGDTTSYQLTTDGERYYSYSFQRDKDTDKKEGASITWSGDSKVFYCLRQDRRNVGEGYLIDHLAEPRPTLKTYKFPMPGEKYVYTYDLHLFDAEKRSHQVVDIAKYPDQEVKVMPFDFNKYPEYIYFTRKSRTCDEMDLCRVDTRTGEVFEIIHERCEPHFTEQLFECRILNGGEDILWWSERSGWGQYYLYNKEGQLKNPVTTGDFVAGRITEMDTLGRSFVFEGYGREKGINPEYRLFYKVNFDGSDLTLLTPGDGFHSIDLAKNGKYLIDNYSRADQEPIAELRDTKGRKIMELERPDLRLLYEMGWRKPERVKVKAADGITDLYGVMYRPFDMDSTRKYPIIINVYPGTAREFCSTVFHVG